MTPLLDVILQHVPPPKVAVEEPFAMCVAMIERDPFVGRVATGRWVENVCLQVGETCIKYLQLLQSSVEGCLAMQHKM